MGPFAMRVFVGTTGDTGPAPGGVWAFVAYLRGAVVKAGQRDVVRVDQGVCFSRCGPGRWSPSIPKAPR